MDVRMAEAVEEASAVLVCFSKKYQESDNCRKGRFLVSRVYNLNSRNIVLKDYIPCTSMSLKR